MYRCKLACSSITLLPDNPGVDDNSLRQLTAIVEDHVTLRSHPDPVPPVGQETIAGAVRATTRQHCEKKRGEKERGRERERELKGERIEYRRVLAQQKYNAGVYSCINQSSEPQGNS